MNFINYLNSAVDIQSNDSSKLNIILKLLILIIAFAMIVLIVIKVVKSNKKNPQQQNISENKEPVEIKNNNKPKEIPIKKPSMIDDPASIRMAIEESKADLSEFNVKQEEVITEEDITKIETTTDHDNKNIEDNVEELIIDENNKDNIDNDII